RTMVAGNQIGEIPTFVPRAAAKVRPAVTRTRGSVTENHLWPFFLLVLDVSGFPALSGDWPSAFLISKVSFIIPPKLHCRWHVSGLLGPRGTGPRLRTSAQSPPVCPSAGMA